MTAVYAYAKANEINREPFDEYRTPVELIEFVAASDLITRAYDSVLDIGANDGRWGRIIGRAAKAQTIAGVDIQPFSRPSGFTHWFPSLDYTRPMERAVMGGMRFNLIVSNPPFVQAEEIIRAAWEQLDPGGTMVFLLPCTFLGSSGRAEGLWRELPTTCVYWLYPRVNYEYSKAGRGQMRDDALYVWCKTESGRADGSSQHSVVKRLKWPRPPKRIVVRRSQAQTMRDNGVIPLV